MKSIVDEIRDIKQELRGLKSRQAIAGSTLLAEESRRPDPDHPNERITYAWGGGGNIGTYIEGTATVRLTAVDGNRNLPTNPAVEWTVSPQLYQGGQLIGELPQFPTNGGTQFYWRPQNMTADGVATLQFMLTMNYDLAQSGGTIDISLLCYGVGKIASISQSWTYHKA